MRSDIATRLLRKGHNSSFECSLCSLGDHCMYDVWSLKTFSNRRRRREGGTEPSAGSSWLFSTGSFYLLSADIFCHFSADLPFLLTIILLSFLSRILPVSFRKSFLVFLNYSVNWSSYSRLFTFAEWSAFELFEDFLFFFFFLDSKGPTAWSIWLISTTGTGSAKVSDAISSTTSMGFRFPKSS